MDRRNQDVARAVAQLHDQFGEVGLPGGDAGLFEAFVHVDLCVAIDLILTTSRVSPADASTSSR